MTIVLEHTVEINRPPDDVFAAIADILNTPEWISAVVGVTDFSGEPVGVGTTYGQVSKLLGKEFTMDVEVIAFEPGERYGERFGGVIPGEMMITFEPVGSGTRLHMHFEGEPGGFFGLAAPLLKAAMKKQVTGDMDKLKKLLEG